VSRLPAAARKLQLLDTAAAVFAERGYNGTTTAELAKAAGVSEPIIYRHFKSKKNLFIELVERTGDETLANWQAALNAVVEPAERIVTLIGGNPMVTPRGNLRYRVIVQAMTEVQDAGIQEALRRHIAKLHTFLGKELETAQKSGQVSKRFSAELTAWVLIHIALGYGTLATLGVPGQGADSAGRHVDDVIGQLLLGDRNYKAVAETL